ncbi:hypothetical protein CCOS865_01279 [Pseudomonas reidholzensis]|uniref:Uncharacterized protein n=1 Tax=Pseudomonas reidholzensis TaxID=1785162 RepID=A0A383RPM8_9PSED|nr:hypothetical protein [Pseudomonas reidholzensis]SYX89039.1 hypothetical protein CCOS865_01279 [Pseudomonas reidholzensis]
MLKLRPCATSLISVSVLALSSPALADFSFGRSEAAMRGLIRSYGYLLGQDYALERIAQLYPALQAPIRDAQLNFASAYGATIMDQLSGELTAGVGGDTFRQVAAKIKSSTHDQIMSASMPYDEAVEFIAEVNNRAKGKLDGTILPYLLATTYKGQPAAEFSADRLQRFNTQGHPKALGLNLAVALPASWGAAEVEPAHIVQKWQSMAGYGQQMITLEVHNAEAKVTQEEIKGMIDAGQLGTVAPSGSVVTAGGVQSVESLPGYWLDYTTSTERGGKTFYHAGRLNAFYTSDKAFLISCMTTADGSQKAQAQEDFKKIQALCPLVVNSVALKK